VLVLDSAELSDLGEKGGRSRSGVSELEDKNENDWGEEGTRTKKNTRDNPDEIALAFPFRASVLGGDDENLAGDGAFGFRRNCRTGLRSLEEKKIED
jgi:hypothetical protein